LSEERIKNAWTGEGGQWHNAEQQADQRLDWRAAIYTAAEPARFPAIDYVDRLIPSGDSGKNIMQLYEVLARCVDKWRIQGYPHPEYSTIAEILRWCANPDGNGFRLRPPQVRALETYRYLRLVEGTPHIFDLYRKLFSTRKELLSAFGVPQTAFENVDYDLDTLWTRIKGDDNFVRDFHLEALRETLTLSYPSYILALAMGAGKTVLIGAIYASEFAMALEYADGPLQFNL